MENYRRDGGIDGSLIDSRGRAPVGNDSKSLIRRTITGHLYEVQYTRSCCSLSRQKTSEKGNNPSGHLLYVRSEAVLRHCL